jgi:DNA-binding HxlR family transcriptional regulator
VSALEDSAALDCSVFAAVEAVGDAWSWLVLNDAIIDGTSRFDAFQARLGIARSTLSTRLSALCANGLMARRTRDYVLTERGRDFLACLMTAMAWGDRWFTDGLDTPVRVSHVRCSERIHGVLRCAACNDVVRAGDVTFDRLPRAVSGAADQAQRHRAPGLDLLQRPRPSSVAATLQVLGDRWSALIVRELFYGSHRFDEFGQRLGIASNILAQRLRRLVDHGIVAKNAYQIRPTRHEYRLTDKGLDLYPVPLSMLAWGDRWVAHGRPPVKLTHRTCGRRLVPELSCSACASRITRPDLVFERAVVATGPEPISRPS